MIVVIGGGPAGLRAAEVASENGTPVTLLDAKPSVGRKFLIAGRGGLNLTHATSRERFIAAYRAPGAPEGLWAGLLEEFPPEATREWAAGLGVETFAAGTGRVYPKEMKAAPLLRRWVERLRERGVRFLMHHRWCGLEPGKHGGWRVGFEHAGAGGSLEAKAVVLALGGGSWPQTGSDGGWQETLRQLGVEPAPLQPANCGWEAHWPEAVSALEGTPLKNLALRVGGAVARGELLITRYGLEGGALYQLGAELRAQMPEPRVEIDFKPENTAAQLEARLGPVSPRNAWAEARKRWRLVPGAVALVEASGLLLETPQQLAQAVKACPVGLLRPRPIAEAISSAGGVRWEGVAPSLMLRKLPGVFAAGEMLDWEAPTGGFLLQGCLATGTRAGRSAREWVS